VANVRKINRVVIRGKEVNRVGMRLRRTNSGGKGQM
jgi:hypothetical protein